MNLYLLIVCFKGLKVRGIRKVCMLRAKKCAKDLCVYFVNGKTIKSNLFCQALYMIRYIAVNKKRKVK